MVGAGSVRGRGGSGRNSKLDDALRNTHRYTQPRERNEVSTAKLCSMFCLYQSGYKSTKNLPRFCRRDVSLPTPPPFRLRWNCGGGRRGGIKRQLGFRKQKI